MLLTRHSGQEGAARKVSACPEHAQDPAFGDWWQSQGQGDQWLQGSPMASDQTCLPIYTYLNYRCNQYVVKKTRRKAVWDQSACLTSLKTSGLYEASGLALWLRCGIYSTAQGRDLDPGDIPFSEIAKFKDAFFSKEVVFRASVQRGAAKKAKIKERLLWPLEMVCGCEQISDLKHDFFDGSLNLASCHFVLWSWFLAVFEALQASDPWLL